MLFTSVLGKSFIWLYRAVKSQDTLLKTATLGRYYKGAFMDPMTRNEAALILGVKGSSPSNKIMAHHRKLMFLNHPDNGGSTFLATKINEAKEVLLK